MNLSKLGTLVVDNTFELFRGYRDLWIGIMRIQHKFPAQLKLGITIFLLTKI